MIAKVRAARVTEFEKAYDERKRKAFQKIIDEHQLEELLGTIHDNLLENRQLAVEVLEVIPVNYCDLKDASYDSIVEDFEDWKVRQFSSYIGQDFEELNAMKHDYKSEHSLIIGEFEKVESMVKQSTSIKKTMVLMEEIGFDLSGIEPEVKHELTTTSINKDLLGLGGSK